MTCIAWDGKTLAADKMTSFGGLHAVTTKVHRVGSLLVAGAGITAQIIEMVEWLRAGADPAKVASIAARCEGLLQPAGG